jgi:cellulose synthase/poly-beta-1,6-N-acetylglucosamine synthase-like glycosyltransferase
MKPEVSLIVPLYNEERNIEKLLNSIFNQNFNKNVEILMVDGMSTDNTIKKIKEYNNKRKNISLKILKNVKRRTPYAFNIGLKNFKGNYFAIIGAHSHLDKNWLKYSYETITNSSKEVMGVGGKWFNIYDKNNFSKSIAYTTSTFFGGGISEYRYQDKMKYVDTVVFGMYKKDVVSKVGYFDTNFLTGQDGEYNLRIIKRGYKLLMNPKIVTHYKVRTKLSKFIKQRYNYGQARMFMVIKHKDYKLKFFVPLLFMVYLLFVWLSIFNMFYLVPFGVYLVLNMYFSLKNIKLFFHNFIVFFVIHAVFGFGELVGFVRKIFGARVVG